MKPKLLSMLAALTMAALPSFGADSKGAGAAQVEVTFDHPENFTDVKDSYMSTDKGRDAYLAQFREYLQERAPKFLQSGQKLSVQFTDIDMAGDFEPWRGPAAQDVRILKAIYIPRLKFTYRLTDADGSVVKEGKADLADMNYQNNIIGVSTQEELRYEKHMLDSWIRGELRTKKK
jgi:hypothetical protein